MFLHQLAMVLLQVFLEFRNRLDLSADSFLIKRFAVLEMSQMPSHVDNFDMSFRQPPKLILFENVDVFFLFRNSLK